MVRTVLTYGDSNTHGTMPIVTPGEMRRFGRDTRWPRVMAKGLGAAWELVEEGLPGRTTQYGDPVMGAHLDGRDGLKIALASHGPVDLLTLMLGTNDLKHRFEPSPARIAAGLAGLLDIALHRDTLARHPGMQVLLICPPAVKEVAPFRADFLGAAAHAAALPAAVAELAEARGLGFFDANTVIETSETDGVHFEAEAHRTLGAALAEVVRGMV
ncbi:GDSL-type esterase/lipase family protein [Marinovum sp.]|uniref:GDSL-type esterase/lipase family protein n=1 Tax=Marinovum sp. TaxID=2024839 RepID=UPI002B271D71|nr:GDSL-type esterase/lipase family protein [Marinovum sp.]